MNPTELLKHWMPNGKVTGGAAIGAATFIALIIIQPAWEEWQLMGTVLAAAMLGAYLMPSVLPWNRNGSGNQDPPSDA